MAAYRTTQTLGFSAQLLGTYLWNLKTDNYYLVYGSGVCWLPYGGLVRRFESLPRGGAARAAAALFSDRAVTLAIERVQMSALIP